MKAIFSKDSIVRPDRNSELDGCICGMPTIQSSARSALLSVHKLFTSCIRRGLVSRDSIVDGDWLANCDGVMSALSVVLSTRIRSVRKIWEYVPCTDCTGQRNDFQLIPTVKVETRYSVYYTL